MIGSEGGIHVMAQKTWSYVSPQECGHEVSFMPSMVLLRGMGSHVQILVRIVITITFGKPEEDLEGDKT